MLNTIDPDKNDHRWGFKDSGFELRGNTIYFKGKRYPYLKNVPLPYLRKFIEDTLGMKLLNSNINSSREINVPTTKLTRRIIAAIKKKFLPDQFSTNDKDRLIHSHGQTTTDEVYKMLYQRGVSRIADGVFYPISEQDLIDIIDLSTQYRICLIPYGGGTSVSSALLLPTKEKRPIVVVDMRKMDRVEWIDKENNLAMIQAGIVGRHLEEKLNQAGYTMGHEPDSIEFSTLGGWISTNASGMKRNRYGNIEDIIINYSLITPKGRVEEIFPYKQKSRVLQKLEMSDSKNKNVDLSIFDRVSTGMQTKKLFFGSEGNLGFISKALVKIHSLPELKIYDSYLFPSFDVGTQFLKALSRTNLRPASVRLVDNQQFQFGYSLRTKKKFFQGTIDKVKKFFLINMKKFDPNQMCLATVVFEGSKDEVKYQNQKITALATQYQGVRAGSENGKRGYSLTMLIAYIRDFISDYHGIGETLESTVPWDRIDSACKGLEEELIKYHRLYKLPGNPFITHRITQLYHSSVCIYTTVGLYLKGVKRPEEVFAKIEKKLRQRMLQEGGSISHHHGVGKLRKQFYPELFTATNKNLLQQVKKSLDPDNIFSVGNNAFGDQK